MIFIMGFSFFMATFVFSGLNTDFSLKVTKLQSVKEYPIQEFLEHVIRSEREDVIHMSSPLPESMTLNYDKMTNNGTIADYVIDRAPHHACELDWHSIIEKFPEYEAKLKTSAPSIWLKISINDEMLVSDAASDDASDAASDVASAAWECSLL
jgi:hypothetical protein